MSNAEQEIAIEITSFFKEKADLSMGMEDKFFLQDGKHIAPKEEQDWRDGLKRAFDLANDALVQKALAIETQDIADTQASRARDAQEMADAAGEEERRLKDAYRDALERQSVDRSR